MQSKFKVFASLLLVFSLSFTFFLFLPSQIFANSENAAKTCPDGGDWVKVDSLSGLTYPYTAPNGKLITEVCYFAGGVDKYKVVNPPVSSYLVSSEVFNAPQGVICTAPGVPHEGCNLQDLSHASFRLVDAPVSLKSLKISKTALTSYSKDWGWKIVKTASVDSLELDLNETKPVKYIVTVEPTTLGSQWKVFGSIRVYNPNSSSVEITKVVDLILPKTKVEVSCPVSFPFALSGKDVLDCTYEKILKDDSKGKNKARVYTTDEELGAETVVKFNFKSVVPVETDECITVTDSKYGLLGEVCANDDISFPYEFEYTMNIKGEKCGESEIVNTATGVTNDSKTKIEDSATVDLLVGGDACLPNGEADDDDDDGEILGDGDVKGATTVVLASTAGEDTTMIYLIQTLLMLATGVSLIYVGREYLNRY